MLQAGGSADMKRVITPVLRFLRGLRRPSKAASARRFHSRGETPASLVIRDAAAADIPALARLHVQTFRETHGGGPSADLREQQYRQKFAASGRWFCLVAARENGDLVGFIVGQPADPPDGGGQVNKIYVLRAYQRLGLGRRLLAGVARRFVSHGCTSMTLLTQPDNPSIWFFDAMGGERLLGTRGEFGGGYRWSDLRGLANRPPI
jgi:ribosomal protein S18 acetylase RimI-like enzyme